MGLDRSESWVLSWDRYCGVGSERSHANWGIKLAPVSVAPPEEGTGGASKLWGGAFGSRE